MKYLGFVFFVFFVLTSSAQLTSKENVIRNTDTTTLYLLRNKFNLDYLKRKDRIIKFLENNSNISKFQRLNGVDREIYDIDDFGNISYYETTNLTSSSTARANNLYNGGSLGLNLQGQNMVVGVWDSGPVRETHVEFANGKVTPWDFSNTYSDHGTHVMGTIIANGTNPNLRGIAFNATGNSFDWSNDYSEMASEAASGQLVSNHSYWIGSNFSTWILGAYDSRAQGMDEITYAAPYYLPVVSAGNDRNNSSNAVIGPHLQNKFGYDLIRGMNNAKNSLTVGAVLNVSNYIDESSVIMSSFSSWGPTDDGRIKPEIVAKGVNVTSTVASSDTAFDTYQGTSMASPAVAGVALLLQQHYNNLFSNFMRSATLKGLILHTADEAGVNPGPDYEFGWGLINATKGVQAVSAKSNGSALIDELTLQNGQTYTKNFTVTNPSDVKVSICWTDRAAPFSMVNSNTVDPSSVYLVNDLDVKIVKNTDTFYPWKLNKNIPWDQATNNSTNDVDIFERIDLTNAIGTYTITVSHKGSLTGGNQNFSLIVTGSNLTLNESNFENTNHFSIYPNPSKDKFTVNSNDAAVLGYVVYDLQGRIILANTINQLNNFEIDLSNYNSGVYIVELNSENGKSTHKIVKK